MMEARIVLHILAVALGGFVLSTAAETIGQTKTATACYGNYNNFLDINCPADTLVNLTSVRNGARLKERGSCPEQTTPENYIRDCCNHMEDDCMVHTHPNSFPAECRNISFCKPQSSWTRTQPTCNGAYYPAMTHYTEMTYECVLLVPRSTTTPSTSTATTTSTTTTVTSTLAATTKPAATTTTTRETTPSSGEVANSTSQAVVVVITPHLVPQDAAPAPDFTPAMIGGMVAGLVGLLITVFVFMFYWGRKRQIRISGGGGGGGGKSRENSVWDFLLANSMSVRAFRGYDNFSSSSRRSLDGLEGSSEDGSPGVRKTPLWLPNNISMDSGQGSESAPVTSDDNCSVITAATLERADRHLHPPPGYLHPHHHQHHHNHQPHLIHNHLSSLDVNQLGAGGQHHHYQSHPHLFHPHQPHHGQQQHRRHSSRRQRRQEEEERVRQREGGGPEEVWGGGAANSFVQLSLQGYRYTVVTNAASATASTGGPGSPSPSLDPPNDLDPADDPPLPSPEGGARRTDSSTLASPTESAVAALRSRTPATGLFLPRPSGLDRAWETTGETSTPSGGVLDAPRATELQQADRSGHADLERSRLALTATESPQELPNQFGVHSAASAADYVNIIVNRL